MPNPDFFPKQVVMPLLAVGVVVWLLSTAVAQTGVTATPQQAPRTAPQVERTLPSYEGQRVTTVEIGGQPDLDISAVEPLLAQKPGAPFSQAKVNQSIAALQQGGRFHAVELEVRPEANGIRIVFVLQPAIYFGIYDFPGAVNNFTYSRLLQVADYPPRGAFTTVDVQNATAALEKFLHRAGFFQATVKPEVRVDKAHGLANVFFHTELKRRAKFGKVILTGASPQETEHLNKVLRSWMARLRGSAIRPGKKYSLKTLQNATQYLENALMKQDRLAAQVKLIGANYDPATNRADINFNVQPGPLVHVKVEGAHLWSWTRNKLLPVYQQAGLGPELIQEGRQNLISYFQSKGYFDAKVTSNVQQQPSGESIVYQVTKGPRHKVAGVDIAGNQKMSEDELMQHVTVEKGHFFSRGKFSAKLLRASAKNLTRLYQANGFSDAKVTPQVKAEPNGNLLVTFRVDEGTQDIVQTLRVEGNNSLPESKLVAGGLKVVPGKPYSTKLVDEDRNRILAHYLGIGFLNATFRSKAHAIGKEKHKLEVVYQITEGPRVQTAKVITVGRRETRQTLISRTTDLNSGQPMRQTDLLSSENRLYDLGIFDWAQVDPRRQITTQTQEDAVVKVHEAKRNSITYGFGFEVINRGGSVPSGTVALPGLPPVGLPSTFKTSQKTFWGPRGTFEYTRKNVRGKAETISIGGLAGRLDQRGQLTFQDPHFRGTNWASNLSLRGEHNSENPIFTSRLGEFGAQLQRALNPDATTNIFIRYNLRETGLTRLLIPDLVPAEDRHLRLSTIQGTYLRDTRDSPLDAHKGIYESFEIGINPRALGSNVNFARFLGQAAYYKMIPGNIIWANSVRLGLEQAFAGSHVPLSERFFSGGGSTLRGFSLNGAGPQRKIPACGDPADTSTCSFIQVPVGGSQLFIVNSELRIPIPVDLPLVGKNLGIATFYDGGNVYDRIGFHGFAENYTNTVGFGIRYKTPVGPVRVDIGHNLNALPGIKSTQIFITLGQAF